MLMMKIRMDTDKIAAEKRYSAAAIQRTLQSAFESMELRGGCTEDGTLIYRDSGREQDFACFGKIVNTLKRQSWFMENVALWRLYDGDGADSLDDCGEEDLLKRYCAKKVS